jgi:hypothetical protein
LNFSSIAPELFLLVLGLLPFAEIGVVDVVEREGVNRFAVF